MSEKDALPANNVFMWLHAMRPQTLLLAATPVLTGSFLGAMRAGNFDTFIFVSMLFAALAIQAATNLLNDAEDGLRGDDTAARQGPPRITAQGLASPSEVRRVAMLTFGLASLCGLYLAVRGGWPIVLIGISSLIAGAAYSAGPKPLSHTPYSELFVLIFFGIIAVAGADYLMGGSISMKAVLIGQALGLFAAGVLHVNNSRDTEEDVRSGRKTLAILAGAGGSKIIYAFFVLLPFGLLPVIAKQPPQGPGVWVAVTTLPIAIWLCMAFLRADGGPAFNRILKLTVLMQLAYALLLCSGIAVEALYL